MTILCRALLVLWFGGLSFVAFRLSVDYFDSFDILNNARRLWGLPFEFVVHRGPLAALLYAPFAGWSQLTSTEFLRLAHLEALGFTTLLVWSVWSLCRRLAAPHALLVTTLFAFSPVVLHYSVFIKEDLPAAALVVFGIRELLVRGVGLSGLAFAGACLLRPQLFPALLLTLLLWRRERKGTVRLYGSWLGGLVVGASVIYALGGAGHFGTYVVDLFRQYGANRLGAKPPWLAAQLLGAAVPLPIAVLAALGALRLQRPEVKLVALWATCGVLCQIFLIPSVETRYFAFVLPALYALAGVALSTRPRWAVAALALTLPWGLVEAERFRDPVFREPRAAELAHRARAQALTGRVLWVGPFSPLSPQAEPWHPADDYFAVFHVWRNGLAFYLKEEVPALAFPQWEEHGGARLPVGVGTYAQPGDAVVINAEPSSYTARTLPRRTLSVTVATVLLSPLGESPLRPGLPRELYLKGPDGLVSLGWGAEPPAQGEVWVLQLGDPFDYPLNKNDYLAYTL